jgi:hypothetical protein
MLKANVLHLAACRLLGSKVEESLDSSADLAAHLGPMLPSCLIPKNNTEKILIDRISFSLVQEKFHFLLQRGGKAPPPVAAA